MHLLDLPHFRSSAPARIFSCFSALLYSSPPPETKPQRRALGDKAALTGHHPLVWLSQQAEGTRFSHLLTVLYTRLVPWVLLLFSHRRPASPAHPHSLQRCAFHSHHPQKGKVRSSRFFHPSLPPQHFFSYLITARSSSGRRGAQSQEQGFVGEGTSHPSESRALCRAQQRPRSQSAGSSLLLGLGLFQILGVQNTWMSRES